MVRKSRLVVGTLIFSVALVVLLINLVNVRSLNDADFACNAGAFVLHGTVMNSSYMEATTNTTGLLNRSVNITAYNLSFANFGGKALTYVNSTSTNATTGNFSLPIRSLGDPASDCSQMYVFTVFYYNTSQGPDPRTWVVEEMGPSFPVLPKAAITRFFDNSTIYLQPAITLNISAINESHNISFNYAVFDNALGYPVAESFASKVFNATLVVQRNRNYSLMMMVTPDFDNPGPNMFSTAAPPQSVSLTNVSNVSRGYIFQILKNLSFSQYTIAGNISVVGNTTPVNVSNILVKLSFGGMLPPNSVLTLPGGISITNATSMLATNSSSMIANYTLVVMGSASGIDQVIEFFASNMTSSSNNTQYFYAIQNFTVTAASVSGGVANVTLRQLAGNFSTVNQGGVSVPTAYVKINLTDSTGRPLSEAHSEITADNVGEAGTSLPQFRYMVDQLTNGVISLPLRLDSNATLKVFSRRYAPLQYKLNLTNASREANSMVRVTINTFKPEMRLSNGSVDDFSGAKGGNVKVTFMRNTYACNSPNASVSNCKIGRDFAGGNFDPMEAMFAGKTNLMMELNSTGVILQFLGVDMMASGPPDSSMSDSASSSQSGSSVQQAWRFGSVAPRVYDKVLIGVPYNQSTVIENASMINVTIKTLFDDSWNLVWNGSSNPLGNGTPAAWSDYNQTWFNVSSGGMPCQFDIGYNDTSFTQGCIVNTTTNYVWMVLPHFSGGDDNINTQTTVVSTPAATPASSGGGASGSGGGGGDSSLPSENSLLQGNLAPGDTGTFTYKKSSDIAITEISIIAGAAASNPSITVRETTLTSSTPLPVSKETGKVYKYISILKSNLENVTEATLKFSVPNEWFTNNSLDDSTIALNRLVSKSWVKLPTAKTGSDDKFTSYEATSGGFSIFAISAENATVKPAAPEKPKAEAPPAPPAVTALAATQPQTSATTEAKKAPATGNFGFAAKVIIVAILVIAAVMAFVELTHKKRGKSKSGK